MNKEQLQNLDLSTIADGAVPILFLEVMSEKVLPNIFDPNTDPKKKRSLAMEIEFMPTRDKFGNITGADILIKDPKVKLAPRESIAGHILLGKIDGQYQAKEVKQFNISDPDEEDLKEPNKPLKAVK